MANLRSNFVQQIDLCSPRGRPFLPYGNAQHGERADCAGGRCVSNSSIDGEQDCPGHEPIKGCQETNGELNALLEQLPMNSIADGFFADEQ